MPNTAAPTPMGEQPLGEEVPRPGTSGIDQSSSNVSRPQAVIVPNCTHRHRCTACLAQGLAGNRQPRPCPTEQVCYNCQKAGHKAAECQEIITDNNAERPPASLTPHPRVRSRRRRCPNTVAANQPDAKARYHLSTWTEGDPTQRRRPNTVAANQLTVEGDVP